MPSLEIACFGARSALIAAAHNADRIELCAEDSQAAGGTTPSMETFDQVIADQTATTSTSTTPTNNNTSDGKSAKTINIRIMIRPRGGDFVYTESEFQTMLESIETFKRRFDALQTERTEGISIHGGFVFGILTPQGTEIDVPRCAWLVQAAAPYPCTFHRAFDHLLARRSVEDDAQAIDDVAKTGFAGILTSGTLDGGAMEGRGRIAGLMKAAAASAAARGRKRMEIVVGGGVRAANARLLLDATGAEWLHSSAIVDDKSGVADPGEIVALKKTMDASAA